MRATSIITGIAAAAVLAAAITPAAAADIPVPLPTKAPAASPFVYPYAGSGIYWGANVVSDGAVDSAGHGTFGTTGGAYGATLGYQWAVGGGTNWLAVEAMADYSNAKGGDVLASTSQTWSFEQRVKLGGNLASGLSLLPSLFGPNGAPPLPVLPSTTGAAAIMHPYIFGGVYERKLDASLLGMTPAGMAVGVSSAWRVAPTVGIGVLTQVTKDVVVDTWGEYVSPSSSIGLSSGPTPLGTVGSGQQWRVGAAVLF